jgi:hypothetical protein
MREWPNRWPVFEKTFDELTNRTRLELGFRQGGIFELAIRAPPRDVRQNERMRRRRLAERSLEFLGLRSEGRKDRRMTEPKNTEATVSKFDDKLHKLIKRAKKERGLLWPAVVSKLELARADVKAMIKVYDSGPK